MQCPICKKNLVQEDSPHRPFCSERCRMIDLDNWLSGRYRITMGANAEDGEMLRPEDSSDDRDEKGDLD